jgi:hypothetical protein
MEYKEENRVCQNCKKDFTIEIDDFSFYEKMKVLSPGLYFECGMSRLTSLRNERIIYWNKCKKCGDKTMSLYHPDSDYIVYCHSCWWKDEWDGLNYGFDYDDSKLLIEQINNLQKKVPREAVIVLNSTNCDYGNNIRDSKDCYFCFLIAGSEHVFYSMWMVNSKDCMEDHKVVDSELVIYSVDVANSYKSAYLHDSSDCSFCYFSYDLKGCNNCLFCSNLRNKSYCFKNKQLTKEEYQKEFEKIFNGSFETFKKAIDEYKNIQITAIHRFSFSLKTTESIGNYLQNCNKSHWCFDGVNSQQVRNVASILYSKDSCFSYSVGTQPTENIFGGCVIKGGAMIKNSFNIFNSSDCTWCDSMVSCNNCIGCVGLKKKEYCILNKQYSKDDYNKICKKIEEKGELSNFIEPLFSTFSYNETVAQDYYPLIKEEALQQKYRWQDDIPMTIGKETLNIKDLPDSIKDAKDDILNQILSCINCQRNYRIVPDEFSYLKDFNLPIPRECPQCRMTTRREMRLPFKLWHRKCMKEGCSNEFETSYAPERPEIVYCEKCYQQEVY